jgi:acyl-coenzyme A thioesterase PaaI-like protein
MESQSLQDRYAPNNACFGCGPANPKGLRIKSFPEGDECVARFTPEKHHEAFDGMLCGGIAGTLLDCHMNWTAAFHLMELLCLDTPPCTVTAEYRVTLKRPTPTDAPIEIRAWAKKSQEDRAVVAGEILAGGQVTCVGEGTFVAVKEGHPAYHRW